MARKFAQSISIDNSFLDLSNPAGVTPGTAPAGRTRIYRDRTSGTLISEDAGRYHRFLTTKTPESRTRYFEDFLGTPKIRDYTVPLFSSNGDVNLVTTTAANVISGTIRIHRSGRISLANLVGATTLAAADNTNYVTVTVTNKGGAGTATIVVLAASDANTTKATGGSAWTAYVPRTLTLTATTENLAVTNGDVLEVAITVTGTLANTVSRPSFVLRVLELPDEVAPQVSRVSTGVGPMVAYSNSGTVNGEALLQLASPNGSCAAFITYGGRMNVDASKRPIFACRAKIDTVGATTDVVFGFASADTAPLDNVTYRAWFKAANNLTLVAETDDNATAREDQATGVTLVTDTYAILEVDLTDLSAVVFRVNGTQVQSLAAPSIPAGAILQPFLGPRKQSSGTAVDACTVDWWGWEQDR